MSSAPWACIRATTASMPSTANMMRRRPRVFTGAFTGPNRTASGVWNLSSSIPCPSGVRSMARVARASPSPMRLPTAGPSTVVWPSSFRPSSTKNAFTASRSSTTIRMLSIRLSVMSFGSSFNGVARSTLRLRFCRRRPHASIACAQLRCFARWLRGRPGPESGASAGRSRP
ncbi:hypothetical protein D3C72_1787130 [compost metagenome]